MGALRVARGGPGKEDRQGLGQRVHSLKAGSGPHRRHQPAPGAPRQPLSAAAAQLYGFSVPKLLLKSGGRNCSELGLPGLLFSYSELPFSKQALVLHLLKIEHGNL